MRSENLFYWALSNVFQWSNLRAAFTGSLAYRERAELKRLYARVESAYAASRFSTEYADLDFVEAVVDEACARAERVPAPPLRMAMCELTWQLLVQEPVIFGMPNAPDLNQISLPATQQLRALLVVKERVLGAPDFYVDLWREKVIRLLEGMMGYFPSFAFADEARQDAYSVPLIDVCTDPA